MARRQQHEEHVNHERWLVSYADFITLLFAFFVVMYSVSSVNEGKYRVLSESLNAAFRQPATSLDPVQVGEVSRTAYAKYKPQNTLPIVIEFEGLPPPIRRPEPKPKDKPEPETVTKLSKPEPPMKELREQLEKAMSSLPDKDLVEIRGNNLKLEIEIKSSILFTSGSAILNPSSTPILENLSKIIKPLSNHVHVEGFTDNIPIRNSIYPSNWELSTARAASVVQRFVGYGVDPRRLAATGYAEFQPIADNDTVVGRRKNRRVVLSIKATKFDSGVLDAITSFDIPAGMRSPGSRTILIDPIYDEIQETKITPARDRVPENIENIQEPGAIITPSKAIGFEPVIQPFRRSAPVNRAPAPRNIPAPRRTLPSEELPVKSGSFSSIEAPEGLSTPQGRPYTLSDELNNQLQPDVPGGQIQETPR